MEVDLIDFEDERFEISNDPLAAGLERRRDIEMHPLSVGTG